MPTTIQLKEKTMERLKFFKEHHKESYDEMINKILDDIEEGELTEQTIEDLRQGFKDIKARKGEPIEKVAKELGIKL